MKSSRYIKSKYIFILYTSILLILIPSLYSRAISAASAEPAPEIAIYAVGEPLGISTLSEGLYVDSVGVVKTAYGDVSPFENSAINRGDILLKVNGKSVSTRSEVESAIKSGINKLDLLGNSGAYSVEGAAAKDALSGKYKLGLYLSGSVEGIGTLTLYTSNGSFAALGHAVSIEDEKACLTYDGETYKATITDVQKSEKGTPGQLKGVADHTEKLGDIVLNNDLGIYGKLDVIPSDGVKIEAATRWQVKLGKAQIRSTISGDAPELYDVEIVKADFQSVDSPKGLTIKVTDERLIEACGGIVRGMSGSPIIQDGKLVGALTHVFIGDPLMGYGVYADFLLNQLKRT